MSPTQASFSVQLLKLGARCAGAVVTGCCTGVLMSFDAVASVAGESLAGDFVSAVLTVFRC